MCKPLMAICGVLVLAISAVAQESEAVQNADQQATDQQTPSQQTANQQTAERAVTSQPAAKQDNHLRDFRDRLIWKAPLAKTVLNAAFNEVRNSPHEWGRGWEGFGKRAGNSLGQRAVKATVELGVSTWTHEDLHYQRVGEGGFFHRAGHAILSAYWVPRDNGDSNNTVALGRITGAFAAGQVSRTWMPSRVATFGAALQSSGSSLALDAGFNLLKEFWPKKH